MEGLLHLRVHPSVGVRDVGQKVLRSDGASVPGPGSRLVEVSAWPDVVKGMRDGHHEESTERHAN